MSEGGIIVDEDEEFDFEAETISIGVRAYLTMSLYVPGTQTNHARTVLVTDAEWIDEVTEKFKGVDGTTAQPIEITVSYPR